MRVKMPIFIYMTKILLCLLFSLPVFGQNAPVIRLAKQIKATPSSVVKVYGYYDYHYKNTEGCDQSKNASIIQNNKISPCFTYISTFEKDDAKKIINFLNARSTYGATVDTTCFETHHALLILEKNVVIGYVNISLTCDRIISNPAIPAATTAMIREKKYALNSLLKLVEEEGLVVP